MHSLRFTLSALTSILMVGFATVASAQTTFVYTANALEGGSISIYKLNPTTGALTPTGGSPLQNDSPAYLAATAGGKFLIVSGGSCPGCGIQVFAINPATGALTLAHAYEQIGAVTVQGSQVISDPAGTTLYTFGTMQNIQGATLQVIAAVHVNADGSLTTIGNNVAFSPGQNIVGSSPMAVDPKSRWVFALVGDNTGAATLFAFVHNADGSLGAQVGAVSLGDQNCTSTLVVPKIAIDPQGKNLFFSCNPNATFKFNGIQVYGINQTTGALSRIDSFTTQHTFEALSSDRQGWRVFAATEETNLVEPFDFNRNVDQLGLLNGGILYHTGAQPNGVAVDPSNKFVYVTNGSFCFAKAVANGTCINTSSGNISGYSFNYTQGTLANLPGSPFASGPGTRSMIFVQVP